MTEVIIDLTSDAVQSRTQAANIISARIRLTGELIRRKSNSSDAYAVASCFDQLAALVENKQLNPTHFAACVGFEAELRARNITKTDFNDADVPRINFTAQQMMQLKRSMSLLGEVISGLDSGGTPINFNEWQTLISGIVNRIPDRAGPATSQLVAWVAPLLRHSKVALEPLEDFLTSLVVPQVEIERFLPEEINSAAVQYLASNAARVPHNLMPYPFLQTQRYQWGTYQAPTGESFSSVTSCVAASAFNAALVRRTAFGAQHAPILTTQNEREQLKTFEENLRGQLGQRWMMRGRREELQGRLDKLTPHANTEDLLLWRLVEQSKRHEGQRFGIVECNQFTLGKGSHAVSADLDTLNAMLHPSGLEIRTFMNSVAHPPLCRGVSQFTLMALFESLRGNGSAIVEQPAQMHATMVYGLHQRRERLCLYHFDPKSPDGSENPIYVSDFLTGIWCGDEAHRAVLAVLGEKASS